MLQANMMSINIGGNGTMITSKLAIMPTGKIRSLQRDKEDMFCNVDEVNEKSFQQAINLQC